MMRSVFFLFVMMTATLVYAEGMAEQAALEHKFSGKIEAGGFETTGNSEVKTVDGAAEFNYSYGKWDVDLTGSATQTSESGTLTSEYFEAELKPKYTVFNHTYVFVLYGYTEDPFGDILREEKLLAGLGYRAFTDEPDYSVDIEVGYGARDSKKPNRTNLDHDPGTHWAVLSEYKLTEEDKVSLDITLEAGNDDDYIKKDLAWVHTLFDSLSVDFSLVTRTNSKPELGKVRTDTTTSIKLGYEF